MNIIFNFAKNMLGDKMRCKYLSKEKIRCSYDCDESGYCVFHKKNKNDFENEKMIDSIKNNKISNMEGFVFEVDFVASEVINFDYLYLNFNEVIFVKKAIFIFFEFKKNVSFDYAKFFDFYCFNNAKFFKNVSFKEVKFTKFLASEKLFENCEFLGQNVYFIKCFNLARLDGVGFEDFTKVIMINLRYKRKHYLTGKINYKIAKTQANKIDDYEKIGYYYYKERAFGSRCMNVKDYPRKIDYVSAKFFDSLAKYTLGYGERPWNILFVTIFTISVFAFLYMIIGLRNLDGEIISINLNNIKNYDKNYIINTYIDFWYFSLITFTTVGYGDMLASSTIGRILVSLEVFFGVTLAATWTSIVIKRLIR